MSGSGGYYTSGSSLYSEFLPWIRSGPLLRLVESTRFIQSSAGMAAVRFVKFCLALMMSLKSRLLTPPCTLPASQFRFLHNLVLILDSAGMLGQILLHHALRTLAFSVFGCCRTCNEGPRLWTPSSKGAAVNMTPIGGKNVNPSYHMNLFSPLGQHNSLQVCWVLIHTYIYIHTTPPPVPRFGSVYTVSANRNNHFCVLILIHGLRLPS